MQPAPPFTTARGLCAGGGERPIEWMDALKVEAGHVLVGHAERAHHVLLHQPCPEAGVAVVPYVFAARNFAAVALLLAP